MHRGAVAGVGLADPLGGDGVGHVGEGDQLQRAGALADQGDDHVEVATHVGDAQSARAAVGGPGRQGAGLQGQQPRQRQVDDRVLAAGARGHPPGQVGQVVGVAHRAIGVDHDGRHRQGGQQLVARRLVTGRCGGAGLGVGGGRGERRLEPRHGERRLEPRHGGGLVVLG
ncbi:hypothetical protein ASF47_05275 [Nocardioides sp. Leaf285]|nr:hypothetical protein ASF47_05275 [Nocardioides sp. Leaf285]